MTGAAHPRAEVGLAQTLRDGYEALRGEVLGGCARGDGLALLLREGMATWIQAGKRAIPVPAPSRSSRRHARLLDDVPSEMATVLAEMALAAHREVTL